MPVTLNLIDPQLLDADPPRRLPAFFLPNLLGEYLLERPLRTYFDPLMLVAFAAVIVMIVLGQYLFAALLFLVGIVRGAIGAWAIFVMTYYDYKLLRRGIISVAHIMRVRPEQGGAHIDCVIPVAQRRSLVGSAWIPDEQEAARLAKQGRVHVIALRKAPGVWRLLQHDRPGVRYGHFTAMMPAARTPN